MVVDTSALIAVLLGEPEAAAIARSIVRAPRKIMSAFSAIEASIVIEARKGPAGSHELRLLLVEGSIEIVSLSASQVDLATEAWRRYGKGRHVAGLNIGDCCSYALAIATGEPLLFKGSDFAQTDVPSVPYQ
ncbi:MAG: type II toxin-antitoxin system VapC family toxin [Spirochaetota bacterium]